MSKHWYTDGESSKQIDIDKEQIPDGWYPGRGSKVSNSLSRSYSKKSNTERQRIIAKRIQTMKSKSPEEIDNYHKLLSQNSKGKNAGKTPWNKGLTKEIDERVRINSEHTSQAVQRRVKEIKELNPEYFSNWRRSINDTMRNNNTFNTSKAEEEYYLRLVCKYGSDGVVRQYSDDRYPFGCDFYIPTEDKFIELNRTWTHGGHPFNSSDPEDVRKLEIWEEKAETSNYYKNAIYTWTDLDVRKRKIAEKNHLNYEVIY